ncbi:MAG TPA: bifunctional DNA primase/polymerase [Polyangiaceae bacterium]|nr:bifunctional DNA primase/polymerase [Polyangiaceae bacterium]
MSSPISWALRYAARGFPVLPLEPHGKAPLARLVRHGVRQATTDPNVIAEWWAREPTANIGLRCLPMLVIDVDPRSGGVESWARLLAGHEPIVGAPTVATPGGGWHTYFAPPAGPVVALLAQGIDVQFGARYVVAPPSIHPSGGVYRWTTPPSGGLARLPDWLAEELRAKPVANNPEEPLPAPPAAVASSRPRRPGERLPPLSVIERARRYLSKCEPAISGQRGAFVTMRVCAALVRGFGLTENEALPLLLEWDRANVPPWGEAELRRKLAGAGSAPAVTPADGRPPIRKGALLVN